MATSLSGSCAQALLRACIWWAIFLYSQQSQGVQPCLATSNWVFAPSNLPCGTVASWQLLLADMMHSVSSDVKQRSLSKLQARQAMPFLPDPGLSLPMQRAL